eukprot:8054153-Pyramimonas_sp.AAC.1
MQKGKLPRERPKVPLRVSDARSNRYRLRRVSYTRTSRVRLFRVSNRQVPIGIQLTSAADTEKLCSITLCIRCTK